MFRSDLKTSLAVVVLALSSTGLACAGEKPGASVVEEWLELQRSGERSVAEPKRVEGEMSQRAYRRLLESFDRQGPAPESRSTDVSPGFGR